MWPQILMYQRTLYGTAGFLDAASGVSCARPSSARPGVCRHHGRLGRPTPSGLGAMNRSSNGSKRGSFVAGSALPMIIAAPSAFPTRPEGQAQVGQQVRGSGIERRIVIALHAGPVVDLFATAGQPRPEQAPVRFGDTVVGAAMRVDGPAARSNRVQRDTGRWRGIGVKLDARVGAKTDRVGGRVTPPVRPHHRAYGFVHGGSSAPLQIPELSQKVQESPHRKQAIVHGRMHVRGPRVPPGASPGGGGLARTRSLESQCDHLSIRVPPPGLGHRTSRTGDGM